ncbi:glycerate kinase [Comamonas testosteroni]|uniref:glycerate kinase type-2 family protein n=1 Tax=Comamonas testosteroni TaxID=285 RepID=UPI002DB7E4EA|nr:glycerate kinase [Comamonas testosteroni]MEB5967380.1 glycerate kinase [Comamonas testosteroni]
MVSVSLESAIQSPREFLTNIYRAAVNRALPLATIGQYLPKPPKGRTLVLGAGKAGASMAQALEALWPQDAPLSGLVVTRYGHTPPRPEGLPMRIEIVEAAHPVPDAASMVAAQRILALTQDLTSDDLVLSLISGGGSSLLVLPVEGLTLDDKQRINRELLESGASIGEMNCVRKHLSRIKGGQLAAACGPAKVITLTISDVPGDEPAVIASGPTVPDETTCLDALSILNRYHIEIPPNVRDGLEKGWLETPDPSDAAFRDHQVHLIATPRQSLEAAAAAARDAGIVAHILSDEIEGESREVGKVHGALARSVANSESPFTRPCVILSGGETTVTVRQRQPGKRKGRGGRAGEFCLGLAQALRNQPDVWALAADTDGIDGVEDNAGAFVTPDTLARAEAAGCKLGDHLDRNDAYSYFDAIGDLMITGPTHTNVNDFRAILIL